MCSQQDKCKFKQTLTDQNLLNRGRLPLWLNHSSEPKANTDCESLNNETLIKTTLGYTSKIVNAAESWITDTHTVPYSLLFPLPNGASEFYRFLLTLLRVHNVYISKSVRLLCGSTMN